MVYNPFTKPIGEVLAEDDLTALVAQSVAEGYYVEYKREFPAGPKIARSIAGFANTYGGWYIVGIGTDSHNVANSVLGFDPIKTHDPIAVVRDSVRHNLDPTPLFFSQVVQLSSGTLVCVVYVPTGQATPIVSRDGRIYRRTSDASEPVPETSRYALDELVERGREPQKAFSHFARDARTFSKEEGQGWAHIYVAPEPLGVIFRSELLKREAIIRLLHSTSENQLLLDLGEKGKISASIPCNTARPTASSVILRQVSAKMEAFNSLTIEYDELGRAKMHIPLDMSPEYSDWSVRAISSDRAKSVVQQRILSNNGTHLKQFDIGRLWLVTATYLTHYLGWLGAQDTIREFRVALRFSEIWRYVPFVDSDHWAEYVEQLGVPSMHASEITVPSDLSRPYRFGRENLWPEVCREQAFTFGLTGDVFSRLLGEALTQARQRAMLSAIT